MLPFISISSNLQIPTYFLIICFGVSVGMWWTQYRAKKLNLSVTTSLDLALLVCIAGFIGGRIFHVLYESPSYYFTNPIKIFSFWEGGFVYYGGLIASLLVSVIYLKKKDPKNFNSYFDLAAPILSLNYLLGRWACFFAGCCYGKSCSLPWSVQGLHPTQLYAVLTETLCLGIILWVEKRKFKSSDTSSYQKGDLFLLWLTLHSSTRIIMEFFRDDFRGATYFFSISTWISLAISLSALALLFKRHFKNTK